ncbi:MAG: hypothetical protein NTV52_10155 [Acidobacteria bacterium]|nr:hypothetical protein [Acidobacteriota bacterium]
MASVAFFDLAEFGLRLLTPGHEGFVKWATSIREGADLSRSAVLVNDSGQAVVALGYVWRYTTREGRTQTSRHENFGSSMQMDVLSGRAKVVADQASFLLAGSKRLITEEGMFGDNTDVLRVPPPVGGYCWVGGGMRGRDRQREDAEAVTLHLDYAFLEDGLCVGPDEAGRFAEITDSMAEQRRVAGEIVAVLDQGGTRGAAFDILQPLAQEGPGFRASPMFAHMGISQLTRSELGELRAWFAAVAEAPGLALRRPTSSSPR